MKKLILIIFGMLPVLNCKAQDSIPNISEILQNSSSIEGKANYLDSPFVTAGNRIYMVGYQNGRFPELGWHIKDEMGGIWDHPIKLFDGFEVKLVSETDTIVLNKATSFTNYPIASKQHFKIDAWNLEIKRWQFVSDKNQSLAVQFIIKNNSDTARNLNFEFSAFSDLRPTWLGERTQMTDGTDKAIYNTNSDYWVFKDSLNPWYAVYSADRRSNYNTPIPNKYQGLGKGSMLGYQLSIPPNNSEILSFFIAGSYKSVSEALENFHEIQKNLKTEVISKKNRYAALAEHSKLTIPDKKIQQAFEWLKYNSAWLVQKVPEIGTGITAGIPDYPWWFGVDSEYALKAYMAIGQTEPVYKTIQLLDSVSRAVNGNGRIIHEMSSNGAVFNKGNINETPQFTSLIWEVYQWNGDKEFLKKYFKTIKNGLKWLLTENDENHNLFPDGFGMMEIHGLDTEMIDVAVYSQKAFADASKIAKELKEDSLSSSYQEISEKLKTKINEEFWSEASGSYADFIGSDAQALKLIEDAIVRADTLNKPWSVKELQETKKYILHHPSDKNRPFVLHHNWVVNTPMEMHIADSEKAKIALKTAEKYTNAFGVFVTGIDRDESANQDETSFKGSEAFSYTGAVMTLPTGVQIIAENNYSNPNMALNYLKGMSRSFSYAFPGSMYEVSPDYGMITQAWNIYGFAIPIVKQFFGIQPRASEKIVRIQPQMPDEWNKASLENVLMNDNEVSVYYEKKDNIIKLKIIKTNDGWTVELPIAENFQIKNTTIKNPLDKETNILRSTKNSIVLELKQK